MLVEPGYLYIGILFIIFLGSIAKPMTILALVAATLWTGLILRLKKGKNSAGLCNSILLVLSLQNFAIGMGAHMAENTDRSLKLLTQIPFMTVTFIWLCDCLCKRKVIDKPRRWFLLLIICILISCIVGFGGVQSALINVRNMTSFFMFYEIGKRNIVTSHDTKKFLKFALKLACFLLGAGIILLIGGYGLYRVIGIHEVYIAKSAPFGEGNFDGRFYTSFFSNRSYIRMGSLFYEPINIAYYFSFCFLMSIYANPWHDKLARILSTILMAVALLLSGGKGGWMIALLGICCITGERMMRLFFRQTKLRKCAVIWIGIIGTFMFVEFYISHYGLAVLNHIWGITNTWKNVMIKPYGYGLGTGGNAAQVLSSTAGDWLSSGGETALLSYIYQIGIQGGLAFIMTVLSTKAEKQKTKPNKGISIAFYIPFILLGVSIMQDNTFTPQCIASFMMFQGAMSRKKLYLGEKDDQSYCDVSSTVS